MSRSKRGKCSCAMCRMARRPMSDRMRAFDVTERERLGLEEAAALRSDAFGDECAAGTCDECAKAATEAQQRVMRAHGFTGPSEPLRVQIWEAARVR